MLAVKQPPTYGYKSVHDLPTPPSTSRASPPLPYAESAYKPLSAIPRSHSPTYQPMPAPHRGLPPPAAMTLPPQQPGPPSVPVGAAVAPHPPPPPPPPPPPSSSTHHSQPHSTAMTQSHQLHGQHSWTTLPTPPQQWQGAEDSMRNWLQARAEEEKTKQEEEKTRQESLRLEQRKVEMDMLRASLGGGIPPPMVPLVFAGMSSTGGLPQAALEWAQQYLQSYAAGHAQALPGSQAQEAGDHQREASVQAHGQFQGATASTMGQGPGAFSTYPASPTRSRGQTLSGPIGSRSLGPSSNLPSLNTSMVQSGQGPTAGAMPPHHTYASAQPQPQGPSHEASPSIYFHHWQPPTSQAGPSSNRPGTPSGETPKKRKATGPPSSQQAAGEGRYRSPPPSHPSSIPSTASPGRKGHKRNRSDLLWYQPTEQSPSTSASHPHRAPSPEHGAGAGITSRDPAAGDIRKHSVTSLLSSEVSEATPSSQGARGAAHHGDSSEHFAQKPQASSAGTASPYHGERGK